MSRAATMTPLPFDVLSAYRADIARLPAERASLDAEGGWVTIGVLLGHAALSSEGQRDTLFATLGEQLRALLGEARWARGPETDPAPPGDDALLAPRIRALGEWIEEEDATFLADAVVQAYVASGAEISELERGRLDALRARLAWKRGDHEAAQELYAEVARRAEAIDSPELEARVFIGESVLARIRGNYPASGEAALRAVALTETHALSRLGSIAHHAFMVVAAMAKDYNTALHHAWRAYHGVQDDHIAAGMQLADIAQLFYESGHFDFAAAGFEAALRRSLPTRARLPALGGLALTAARLGRRREVARIADVVQQGATRAAVPHAVAATLLDAAEACFVVGEDGRGMTLRDAGLEVARSYAYHELTFRAERLGPAPRTTPSAPARLTPESEEIGSAVRELAGTVA